MPFSVKKNKSDQDIGSTGGNAGVYELDRYLRFNFGPPSFVAYKLPANALVKWIVLKSSVNQSAKISGSNDDYIGDGDILPAMDFIANEVVIYPANIFITAETTLTSDASELADLNALFIYVDITI